MKKRWSFAARVLLATLLHAIASDPAQSQLQVSRLIGEGMVMQRDAEVPIWGRAVPGDSVTVTFRGQTLETTADAAGRWEVWLGSQVAGGPYTLSIVAGSDRLEVGDLMVGDVWVCSGQSNMEWVVADSMNAAAEIALARDGDIRHFKVPRSWAVAPQDALAGGAWRRADSGEVGDFSAVGYFFAREVRRNEGVAIGLINATWGGSRIEAWMRPELLGLTRDDLEALVEEELQLEQEILARLSERVGGLTESDPGLVDGRALWAAADLDDSAWEEIAVPSLWEEAGFEGMDGIAWYRTEFDLTAAEAASAVRLGLGMIDDSDISWVNGHEVGRTEGAWNRIRGYEVPAAVLRPGRNVVAIRVEDTGGGGGIYGAATNLYVESGSARKDLDGRWKFRPAVATVNLEDLKREQPAMLYNRMIHPLERYPVRGFLWYQGESNAWPDDAFIYRDRFRDMIRDWRRGWGGGELPFLFVQLANFLPPPEEPVDSSWALLRESQSMALSLPAVAQVVTIDAGEGDDIHPTNKQVVGHRLALAARRLAYGDDIVFSGPTYRDHEILAGRMSVGFDHVGEGLVGRDAAGESLRGFAIAGEDRRFVWADAAIEGDRVVVWSEEVPRPVAVRYAWADNPEGANLYNLAGLPASPFRTDAW